MKVQRNTNTAESREMWDRVDAAAASAPQWVKDRIDKWIDDGFGNQWPAMCDECGEPNQIVRPGKVQCGC